MLIEVTSVVVVIQTPAAVLCWRKPNKPTMDLPVTKMSFG